MLNSNAKGSRTPIEGEARTPGFLPNNDIPNFKNTTIKNARLTSTTELKSLSDKVRVNKNSFQDDKEEAEGITIGDIIDPDHCQSFTDDSSRLKTQNINEDGDTPTLQIITAINKQAIDEITISENEKYRTWEELFNDIANDYITTNFKSLPPNLQKKESPLEREQASKFHTTDNLNDSEKVWDTLQPLHDMVFNFDVPKEKGTMLVSADDKHPRLKVLMDHFIYGTGDLSLGRSLPHPSRDKDQCLLETYAATAPQYSVTKEQVSLKFEKRGDPSRNSGVVFPPIIKLEVAKDDKTHSSLQDPPPPKKHAGSTPQSPKNKKVHVQSSPRSPKINNIETKTPRSTKTFSSEIRKNKKFILNYKHALGLVLKPEK